MAQCDEGRRSVGHLPASRSASSVLVAMRDGADNTRNKLVYGFVGDGDPISGAPECLQVRRIIDRVDPDARV